MAGPRPWPDQGSGGQAACQAPSGDVDAAASNDDAGDGTSSAGGRRGESAPAGTVGAARGNSSFANSALGPCALPLPLPWKMTGALCHVVRPRAQDLVQAHQHQHQHQPRRHSTKPSLLRASLQHSCKRPLPASASRRSVSEPRAALAATPGTERRRQWYCSIQPSEDWCARVTTTMALLCWAECADVSAVASGTLTRQEVARVAHRVRLQVRLLAQAKAQLGC